MADLSGLYQTSPGMAAFYTGQQQSSDMATQSAERQRLAQLIQQIQIANQQSQAMNPLLQQHQDLQNQEMQAQIPGLAANSALAGTNAAKAAGTLQSDIAVGNSNNQTTQLTNNRKMLAEVGQMFSKMGTNLENVPDTPGARLNALRQMMVANGLQENDPRINAMLQSFSSVSSAKLPAKLQEMGNAQLKQSEQYLSADNVEQQRAKAGITQANIHAQAQRDVAGMNIEAGKFANKKALGDFSSQVDAQIMAAKGDPVKVMQINIQAATIAQQSGMPDKAMEYMARAKAAEPAAQAVLSARPNPQAPSAVTMTGLAPQAAPSLMPQGGPSAPVLGESTGGVAGMESQAKAAWGSYDPGKYQYRIGPNGKLQRAPK